jgi:plastocyanin
MARMRSLRLMARVLPAVAIALLALGVWSSQATAAFPMTEIAVTSPEGDARQAWLADIKNPEIYGKYWFPGESAATDVPKGNGISVAQILTETGTEDGYRTIKIKGPAGEFEIKRGQISGNPEFQPFFYLDAANQVHFVQPTDGPSAADPNGYFPITSAAFGMTQVGGDVSVKVKASRTKIDPGESVTFTATATPSDSYRYDWTFEQGVGRDDAGSKVTHRFKKAGKYQVAVGVRQGDDPANLGGGGIVIQVGEPKKSDKDQEGGGDNTASDAPSTGLYSGSSGSDSTYTPSVPVTPSTPTPPPPTPPSTEPPKLPDIATDGTTVEGNLLADVSDPPPSNILESAARAAREGKQKDDASHDGDAGVSEAALSIGGLLALLALGAGIETRQGRLPRLRLPRRAA